MSGRARGLLAWLVHGDVEVDWRWRGRALVPALLLWGLVALVGLHPLLASERCFPLGECRTALAELAAARPAAFLGAVVVHAFALALAYGAAVVTTSVAGSLADLETAVPSLFAPDDAVLAGVLGLAVASLLAYLAGVYGGAYTPAGAAVLYVLFFPLLAGFAGFLSGANLVTDLPRLFGVWEVSVVLGTLALLLLVLAGLFAGEVLWLYALAHAAVRAIRTGQPAADDGARPD